jgi:uncharacterized protein (DUF885 family)
MSEPRRPTAVDRIADEYLDASAALDPVSATFAGLPGHDDRMTDYSPAGHAARTDLARRTLAALVGPGAPVASDDVDVVTVAALAERLEHAIDTAEAGLDLADLNNIACPVQSVREVFDVAPTATDDDWTAIGDRLRAVPEALRGYRESLLRARAGGWVPARRQVRIVADQADEFGVPEGFFAELVSGRDSAGLAAGATAAAQAYAELGGWLRAELLPAGRDDDAVGADVYAVASRGFLGARIDLADTYAWALDRLAAIDRRAAEVAARVVPAAARDGAGGRQLVDAAIAALEADPRHVLQGTDALLAWMQETSDRAVSALAGTHFDIPEPLRRLECRIAPSTAGGIYYTGPTEDLSRPGRMWWSVPPGVTSFATWQETTTVYHEGVPGHHLQIGLAATNTAELNRWRRLGCWVSGHGEGWALYAERLMAELGFLDDPGELLGLLDSQALRACRVVVDIGVHLRLPAPAEVGGGTWDAEKAWAFLSAHTRLPEPTRRFELDRYLGWPGQAISYQVGERLWLELRDRAAREPDFDLRAFHGRALRLGSVGLDVLRDALEPAAAQA